MESTRDRDHPPSNGKIGGSRLVVEATARLEAYSHVDAERAHLIGTLLNNLALYDSRLSQLEMDLDSEVNSRRNHQMEARQWEQKCADLENELAKHEQRLSKDNYAVVLVDGDGAKFSDRFLQDINGAERASHALRTAIQKYLIDDDIPILIRVYANLTDLARSLSMSRVIQRPEEMVQFAEAFTNSRAEVDFINVGKGKENADSKIRKMLSHYAKSLQCKKIFLACCHDNGYLHELREYKHSAASDRIVLVETTPAEPGFLTLGFPIARFDNVFRTALLNNETKRPCVMKAVRSASNAGQSSGLPPGLPANSANRASSVSPTRAGGAGAFPAPPKTNSASPTSVSVKAGAAVVTSRNGGTSISYAAAGGGTETYQNIMVKPSKSKKEVKKYDLNADQARLDEDIRHPGSDTAAQRSYQAKLESIHPLTLCNDHYLTGHCSRPACQRKHDVPLTPAELAIHRYKARTSPCPKGPACPDYGCYLSHHCHMDPYCTRGNKCKFANTKWGSLHYTIDELKPV